jgi:hypothetical protein
LQNLSGGITGRLNGGIGSVIQHSARKYLSTSSSLSIVRILAASFVTGNLPDRPIAFCKDQCTSAVDLRLGIPEF